MIGLEVTLTLLSVCPCYSPTQTVVEEPQTRWTGDGFIYITEDGKIYWCRCK